MTTLYREYRPKTFKEVVGQEVVVETLKKAIVKKKLTHAYLFYGPRGTGKTTMARLLAKRVNCKSAKGAEACGRCASCKALASGKHMDVIEIDAASNRGIDDIRELKERVNLAPAMGKYKVYIIDEVHMLTREAASALLKTLEEPVSGVIFILATTELHKVIATILSRCQLYRFRRATDENMRERLKKLISKEKRKAEEGAVDFIIERSDGCYRDAESLLGQMLTLKGGMVTKDELVTFLGLPPRDVTELFLLALVRGESQGAIEAVDRVFVEGYDPEQFLKESILLARDGALELAKQERELDKLPAFAGESEAAQRLPLIIRTLLQALQDLAYVPQPLIALHLAILTLCNVKGEAKKADVQPTTTVQATDKSAQDSEPKIPVDKVAGVWEQLIANVKKSNPVAATFLRAIEPVDVVGDRITLRAQYSLHRNFFDGAENAKLLSDSLSELLGVSVRAKCILDENGIHKVPSMANRRQEEEQKFQQTVKDIFGK